jgi:peptidoglycan/xylan/chitin deacetylase (PgdA/CDA1 family)
MIEIKFPFFIDNEYKIKYLLENDFDNHFSLKQKVYYNFVRPFIPIPLRQKLQEKINSRIKWEKNFIDAEFVNLVTELQETAVTNFKYYGNKNCAILLTHDVEEEHGFRFIPKVIELEEKYGFKSSWNIVPYKYKIDSGIISLIKEMGHEIGIHGYNHDGKLYYSEKIFNERVPYINKALKKYGAVGFRSPMVHRNLNWLQKLDIEYDASCFDYDPFQPFPGGTGSIWPFIAGKFVELPYTLPQDHTLFYVLNVKNIDLWIKKVDWIVKNHGVVLTLTHPDYLMEDNHLAFYEELLVYLKDIRNSCHCLPRELANYWKTSF